MERSECTRNFIVETLKVRIPTSCRCGFTNPLFGGSCSCRYRTDYARLDRDFV